MAFDGKVFVLYRITRHGRNSGFRSVMGTKECDCNPGATVHQGAVIAEPACWEDLLDAINLYGRSDEQSHDHDPLGILRHCHWGTTYGWKPGEYRHRLEIQQIIAIS